MKSLVLKDLFNIGHNAKSMLFILVVFAVALIPFSGVEGYIFVCAILCSMMIVTTFSFDDSSKCRKGQRCMGAAAPHSLQLRGHHRDSKRTSFTDTRCIGEYEKRRSCELRPL